MEIENPPSESNSDYFSAELRIKDVLSKKVVRERELLSQKAETLMEFNQPIAYKYNMFALSELEVRVLKNYEQYKTLVFPLNKEITAESDEVVLSEDKTTYRIKIKTFEDEERSDLITFGAIIKSNKEDTFYFTIRRETKNSVAKIESHTIFTSSGSIPSIVLMFESFLEGNLESQVQICVKGEENVYLEIEDSFSKITKTEYSLNNYKLGIEGKIKFNYNFKEKKTIKDYLKVGLSLQIIVCVDFTDSNKNPNFEESLHYLSENDQNDYEKVLSSIGAGMFEYSNLVRLYGFGAILEGKSEPDFKFEIKPTLLNTSQQLVSAYRKTVKNVKFAGPSYFRFMLAEADKIVKRQVGTRKYTLMVVLTDGNITDMEETVKRLIDLGKEPFSVVFIGIGYGSKDKMEIFNNRDQYLKDFNGRIADRHVTKYVDFNDFGGDLGKFNDECFSEVETQIDRFYSL